MTILSAVVGALAVASFFAPATMRYATLSSSDVPAAGGPLVLASESPRELVVRVGSLAEVRSGEIVLSTNTPGEPTAGLTVRAAQGGGAVVSLPVGLEEPDLEMEVTGQSFALTYAASGSTSTVTVDSGSETTTETGAPVAITGIFTPSEADVDWQMNTQPSGSTPTTWAAAMWTLAAVLLVVVLVVALRGLPARRLPARLDPRLGVLAAAFWLALAVLQRANFDDGWILAQSRLYDGYGWFSMYWENAALPAPTGYLWGWALGIIAGLSDYQYVVTRILASAATWFAAWYLVDRTLRHERATMTSRIVAFAVVAAVGGGIGMNVRPEFFTAVLASGVLLLASREPTRFGTRGILVGALSGVAIGSHPAGWIVALPAAAIVIRDARATDGLTSRALVLIGGAVTAGATLAAVVTVDSSASVALPAVDYLSSGPLQGRNPFDELARINDLAGMSPNFRMGMAMVLLAIALAFGWLLRSERSPEGFLIACSALSILGLALTTSKWAAHTAAVAPATAVIIALSWPLLVRTTSRVAGVLAGLAFVALWSFRGDVSVGGQYPGHGPALPGDQLFTSPDTAWKAALLLLAAAGLLFGATLALRSRRPVLASVTAVLLILLPNLAVAATSAVEVRRAGDRWSLTAQHLKPTSDCGAAEEMPVFFEADGTLADPTRLPTEEVADSSERSVPVAPDDRDVAVWVSSAAGPGVRLQLVGRSGKSDLERHESYGADFAMWTGRLDSVDRPARLRVVNPGPDSLVWSQPLAGRVAMWGDGAAGVQVLQPPFTVLQIPCTQPLPMPLDTLTEETPLVWTGDVFSSPAWWLPVRLAGPNMVYSVSAGAGPVGLNTSMMAPTELARAMRPASCVTGWLDVALDGCTSVAASE